MQVSVRRSALAALHAAQQALEAGRCARHGSAHDVLAAGEALLSFAQREDEALAGVLQLLDPAVRMELSAEHDQLADDLGLLEWLLRTTPESPDVSVLSVSLARRMRQHLERDERLLNRSLALGSATNQNF